MSVPKRPKTVTIKGAQKLQAWLIGGSVVFGFVAYGTAQSGGDAFGPGLIAFILFVVGCMIKTTKKWQGGVDVYK